MKLTTLGTSYAVPQEDRFCSCSILETNGDIYVFDAGAPLAELLVRHGKDITKVRAVFITHAHADHIAGLAHFVCLCNWFYRGARADIFLPTEGARAFCLSLAGGDMGDPLDESRLHASVYNDGEVYRDENITVTAYPSAHIPAAHSLWVTCEGKNALFTGDLDPEYKSLTGRATTERTAFTLIGCGHQSAETARAVFSKIKADKLLVTHVGRVMTPEELAAVVEVAGAITVRDGDEFEF